jgi:RES domain
MARPDPAAVPGPHPDPPSDLAQRALPTIACASTLYRVHVLRRRAYFFGASGANRWDAPAGEFKVFYAGATPFAAFAETLLPAPGAAASITHSIFGATVPVSAALVAARGLARVTVRRPLQCVDLTGPGLARIGADARLAAGPHRVTQRWSLALWRHPATADGIVYRSRRDPSELAVAVYDRAAGKITVETLGGLKDARHRELLAQLYARYRIAEVP